MKSCEHVGCTWPAVYGERFCTRHRAALLDAMNRDGYLTPYPRYPWRNQAPVYTYGAPWWDDLVKAYEEAPREIEEAARDQDRWAA
jgi:hypothetical protein